MLSAASGIQTSCTQPSQCSPYGAAFCPTQQPRQCRCFDYAKYNEVTQLCEMNQGLDEFCEKTENCKIENTVCNTERNTCECKPNFIAQNNSQCKPGMNAECEITDDCAFENAECKVEVVDETTAKKCQCKDEFVAVENVCLEKGKLKFYKFN